MVSSTLSVKKAALAALCISFLIYLVTYFRSPWIESLVTTKVKPFVEATGGLIATASLSFKKPSYDAHKQAQPIGADGNITQRHAESWKFLLEQLNRFPPSKEEPYKTNPLTEPLPLFREAKNDSVQQCYSITDEDLLQTQRAHAAFVANITAHPPSLYYYPDTRGIVTTVGPGQLPTLVISLRMLRRTGSMSSVEVFLSSPRDYEQFICEIVLPALNAKCLILSDVLGDDVESFRGWQFKFLAILFSTFEEVLFLDADVFPLRDPAFLFDPEPFKSYGYVVWPDFWASTASPYIHTIISQPVPPRAIQPAVEAGQLLISRKTHQVSLFLVAYYNYYGNSHYFRLFSQGALGEGDKETWRTAAAVMKQPFYQVHEPVQGIGRSLSGSDNGNALLHYDPTVDYLRTLSDKHGHNAQTPKARPMFIHANVPEFNPLLLVGKGDDSREGHTWHDGQRSRIWPLEVPVMETLGDDIEKQLWEEVMWVACELEGKFVGWREYSDTKSMCERVHDAWNDIFEADLREE
ncbi:Mannosyltransferase putative domain containing protein [Elaphomyces granulatus]